MSKIINGIHVLTYDEWIKIPQVKELYDAIEDCSICDGEGAHTCECGHEHDCESCDGNGKVESLRIIYSKTLKIELEKFLHWKQLNEIIC